MSRILLIEPDRVLAEVYQRALTWAGHEVLVCAGAQAAILAADETPPDVVVVELQLIEHSGIEFLYEFRSYPDWQTIPVIMQTHVPPGKFTDSWQLLKDELEVHMYLYKPHTSLQKLINAIQEALAVKENVGV